MNISQLQPVPVFLIVFAAICIAIGSHFQWHDLVSFAVGVGGAGIGILRGSLSRKDADAADVPPNP